MAKANAEQQLHALTIAKEASDRIVSKYLKGQEEHGGNLWDKTAEQLIDYAIDEAVDQVIYLITLKRLKKIPGPCKESIDLSRYLHPKRLKRKVSGIAAGMAQVRSGSKFCANCGGLYAGPNGYCGPSDCLDSAG